MELKVWVEGIQRIVCGVNEKTTCQDVVFALAHATGRTGRFTLIERWRNNERLLGPNEQPLKVLLKKGEHSSDVHFILQWSPLEASPSKRCEELENQNQLNSESSAYFSASPLFEGRNRPDSSSPQSQPSYRLPNKDDEESGSPGSLNETNPDSYLPSSTASSHISNIIEFKQNSNIGLSSGGSHNKAKGGNKGAQNEAKPNLHTPPPYREPPQPNTLSKSVSSNRLFGKESRSSILPPYREPPPPNISSVSVSSLQKAIINSCKSSPTISSHSSSNAKSEPSPSNNAKSEPSPSSNSSSSINAKSSPGDNPNLDVESSSPNVPFTSPSKILQEVPESDKAQKIVENGDSMQYLTANKKQRESWVTNNPISSSFKNLIGLINSQRVKITSQQAELTQFDAELIYWEGKANEQERHKDALRKEIARLEYAVAQNENQVFTLSHLEDESVQLNQENESLKSEVAALKQKLTRCEAQLHKFNNSISSLTEDLIIQDSKTRQRLERLESEYPPSDELRQILLQIEGMIKEAKMTDDLSGTLEKEVHLLELHLGEKKKEMEHLVSEMKEANLLSLQIQSSEDGRLLSESGAHQRAGSTRRMIGSPRQLENAAPTSKNPHGVWV